MPSVERETARPTKPRDGGGKELDMHIYDPVTSPNKAFAGPVHEGHPFLGYELRPGSYPPSTGARAKLQDQIGALIAIGHQTHVVLQLRC